MNKPFDDILEECLGRVLSGGSIEECLAAFPEYAGELRPLLETALEASRACQVTPSPEFKARARYQFRMALNEAAAAPKRSWLGWVPRWAPVTAIIVAVLGAGGGTVAAAGGSMPDSPLYRVKMAAEQVQLGLTHSNEARTQLAMDLAERRVVEIAYMANKGDVKVIEDITEQLDRRLGELTGLVASRESAKFQGASAPERIKDSRAASAPKATPEPQVTIPAPTPTPGPAPSVAVAVPAPTPTIAQPPQISAMQGPETGAPRENEDKSAAETPEPKANGEKNKLRAAIARFAVNHPALLQKILEEAPEESKEALRHSIAVLVKGYGETLRALD